MATLKLRGESAALEWRCAPLNLNWQREVETTKANANVPVAHRKGLQDLNSNQNLASGAAAGAGCCGVSWL